MQIMVVIVSSAVIALAVMSGLTKHIIKQNYAWITERKKVYGWERFVSRTYLKTRFVYKISRIAALPAAFMLVGTVWHL